MYKCIKGIKYMKKKITLASALHEASGKKTDNTTSKLTTVKNKEVSQVVVSRMGKKLVSGHFDIEVSRQLKQIALNNHTTLQNILAEALNDLFTKYNQKPLAS